MRRASHCIVLLALTAPSAYGSVSPTSITPTTTYAVGSSDQFEITITNDGGVSADYSLTTVSSNTEQWWHSSVGTVDKTSWVDYWAGSEYGGSRLTATALQTLEGQTGGQRLLQATAIPAATISESAVKVGEAIAFPGVVAAKKQLAPALRAPDNNRRRLSGEGEREKGGNANLSPLTPKRVMVSYKSQEAGESARRRLISTDLAIRRMLDEKVAKVEHMKKLNLDILELSDSEANADLSTTATVLCDALKAGSGDEVECELDQIVHAKQTTSTNDPYTYELWGFGMTNVEGAWSLHTGASTPVSERLIVAILDTGVDYNHPDLKDAMWVNEAELNGLPGVDDDGNGLIDDVYGYDFTNGDADPMDDEGHGTHVAGTIGAVANNGVGLVGVTQGPRLMSLKFLRSDGAGLLSDAVRALEYASEKGVSVVSNSWGGAAFSASLRAAIEAIQNDNMLFICAAGNENINNDVANDYPSAYALPNIMTVSAVDRDRALASFASYGPNTIDIVAPGVQILSMSAGDAWYAYRSGTSMAVPHVSGAAALVLSASGGMPFASLRQLLEETSQAAAVRSGEEYRQTKGRVLDVQAAVARAVASRWVSAPSGLVSVEAGASAQALLEMAVLQEGTHTAVVDVRVSSSGVSEGSVTLTAQGKGVPQMSSALPARMELEAGDSVPLLLTNSGTAPLAIGFVSLEGVGKDAFSVSLSGTSLLVLPAGQTSSQTLTVSCLSSVSEATQATLTLTENSGSTSPADLQTFTTRSIPLSCAPAVTTTTTTTTSTTTTGGDGSTTTTASPTPVPPSESEFWEPPVDSPLWQYERIPGWAIMGQNARVVEGVGSPAECAAACDSEASFACVSFEHELAKGLCKLSAVRRSDSVVKTGNLFFQPGHGLVDMYEKYEEVRRR